jgi:hypothetical protein
MPRSNRFASPFRLRFIGYFVPSHNVTASLSTPLVGNYCTPGGALLPGDIQCQKRTSKHSADNAQYLMKMFLY